MTLLPLRFPALIACLLLAGMAATTQAVETDSDKPTLVKIHANWCGTCARTEGTWEQLKETYGDSANFVIFDVTDREALQQSQADAKRLGLSAILDEYKSSTGTIAVVSASGETLGVFKGVSDPERYGEAIGQACTS